MSRVSQKSQLSPAATRGSNAIDLGKNSGVDMGRKAQPSVTSGGIGVTQEVTSIGGATVRAGVNVDLTPVDFGITVNPSEGTVSVATGAEVPGGLLGISGGIEIDTNTGQVIGGSLGGEIGGLGINVSNSQKGGLGIEFTLQIPGTPIELSLGFGFPPDPKTPTPGTGTETPGWEEPILPPGRPGVSCTIVYITKGRLTVTDKYNSEVSPYIEASTGSGSYNSITGFVTVTGTYSVTKNGQPPVISTRTVEGVLSWKQGTGPDTGLDFVYAGPARGYSGSEIEIYKRLKSLHFSHEFDTGFYVYKQELSYVVIGGDCSNSPPTPELPPTPNLPAPKRSFPNPPPRKRNMDECCRESTKLLREIHKRLGISKFPGKLPETIIQETPEEGVAPAEPAQVPIEDFVDLLDWQFRRDDERWGKWQVELDIKD